MKNKKKLVLLSLLLFWFLLQSCDLSNPVSPLQNNKESLLVSSEGSVKLYLNNGYDFYKEAVTSASGDFWFFYDSSKAPYYFLGKPLGHRTPGR